MPGYMRIQTDINQKMRAILIDWLVSVHLKLDLKNETLYLTVNLLDRYLATTWVSKSKLQLVGIVALLIACKYEEIYPPLINDLIALTDNAFNREEFLETELKLMSSLRFKITFASSSLFVDRYADVIGCDPKSYALARYLIELAMIEYKMLKYTPSIVGASAVNLACKLFGKPSWSTKMTNAANYIESQLLNCMKDLLFLLKYSKYSKLTGIRDKYSKEKLMRVSLIDFFSKP